MARAADTSRRRRPRSVLLLAGRVVRAAGGAVDAGIALIGRRAALALGVALIVCGIGLGIGPLPRDFYATAAQVLPAFLLVAVIEGRFFAGLGRRPAFDRFVMRGMLATALAGEAAAMTALVSPVDGVLPRGIVVIALGCAGLLVWAYAVEGPARDPGAPTTLELADRVRTVAVASATTTPDRDESPGTDHQHMQHDPRGRRTWKSSPSAA